jgi:hypothetical protein
LGLAHANEQERLRLLGLPTTKKDFIVVYGNAHSRNLRERYDQRDVALSFQESAVRPLSWRPAIAFRAFMSYHLTDEARRPELWWEKHMTRSPINALSPQQQEALYDECRATVKAQYARADGIDDPALRALAINRLKRHNKTNIEAIVQRHLQAAGIQR